MNNTDNALSFDAVIQNSQFNAQIQQMVRDLKGLSDTSVSQADRMDQAFSKLGRAAAGYFAFTELAQLPQKLIQVRGEFQQLETSFKTMLGSKAAADKLMGEVVKFAATTPFDLAGVAGATKQLLAYGFASDEVLGTLRRLGDVASGLNIPLNELTEVYGKARVGGRLYAEDFNKFIDRGIPLIQILAKQFKVADSEVKKLVENGKVGFQDVEKAIISLTDVGGMFAGLTAENAKSLTGLYSNFEDTVAQAFNNIGKSQEGVLAGSIKLATLTVENYEPILDILTVIIATYGAYKAAVIATAAVQAVAATGPAISAWLSLAGSIRSASDAQALFNLTTKANPYVIAATALVALVTAVALFRDTTSEADKAMLRVANSADEVEKSMSSELATIQSLTTQIKNQNSANGDREKALKQLIALNPELLSGLNLENVATQQGAKAIDTYIEAKKKQIELKTIEKELDASMQREIDAKNNKNEVGFGTKFVLSAAASTGEVDYINQVKKANKDYNEEIQKTEKTLQTSLLERIKLISEAGAADNKNADSGAKNKAKTITAIEDEIKSLKESQKATSTTRAEYEKYQKQIDVLEKKQRAITGELTSAQKKASKDADKVGPYGSLSYWDNVAQKAQEIIDKTPVLASNASKIQEQYRIKFNAEKQAEDIRKSYAIKSFDDELSEKRDQFALYQRWVEAYGKEAADKQFETLVSGNESYLDYLNTQIRKLESTANYTKLNKQDTSNLDSLISEKNRVTNKDTGIEQFNKQLQDAQDNAGSLTEALENLKQIQSDLGAPKVEADYAKAKVVAEKILDIEKQRKDQLKQFLLQVTASNQKRVEIEKYYNDLLIQLDRDYADKSSKEYIEGKKAIELAKKKETDDTKVKLLQETEAYKELEKVILETGVKAIELKIQRTKEALEAAKKLTGTESDEYRKLAKELQGLNIELDGAKAQNFQKLVGIAGDLGSALSESNGALGEMGKLLTGAAQSASGLSVAFSKTSTSMDRWAAAAQSAAQLIGIVVNASKQRKEAEEAYYRSIIGQQTQYNLLLNEQLGMQAELSGNVFVDDFAGRMDDSIKMLHDAQEGYSKALEMLDEGRVKDGQRNAVDWNAVGKGAVTGVTLGASIGSVIPVIGTAIGGVVGGVVGGIIGLFGGKKKKDEFVGLLAEYPELIEKGADGQERINKALAQSLIQNNLLDDKTKDLVQNAIDWSDAIDKARDAIKGVISELSGQLGDNLRNSLVTAFEDGTDAAQAFGDSVDQILEDMLSQLIFNAVFKNAFDQLQKEMVASSDIGGDGSWIDDFGRFYAQQATLINQFNEGLTEAQKEAQKFGLSIFTPDQAKDSVDKTAKQGTVTGASEEAINILNGQINAIRITQADGVVIARNSLLELSAINKNTFELYQIRADISSLLRIIDRDWLRATGG